MYRRIIAIVIMLIAVCAQAQVVKLPARDGKTEMIASASKFNIADHIPAFDLKELNNDGFDSESEAIVADMLDYARSFMGLRYRRGGKTPAGFDCSGFTGFIFKQFGYRLGASSRDQWSDGMAVANDDIRPGDLLFFNGRSASSGRIGHVGIAISADPVTGDVTFIHSAISSGISIDRISAPYYAKRFVGARRVVGAN